MFYRVILATFLGHLVGNYLWAVCISRDYAKALDRTWFTAAALGNCALSYYLATS